MLKTNKHLAELMTVIIMGTATFLSMSVDGWVVASAGPSSATLARA